MNPSRVFPIGAVLTLAVGSHDRLYCPLSDLYDVLGHLLATVPAADDLAAAVDYCRAPVLLQHPELATVTAPPDTASDTELLGWLADTEAVHGATLELTSLQART